MNSIRCTSCLRHKKPEAFVTGKKRPICRACQQKLDERMARGQIHVVHNGYAFTKEQRDKGMKRGNQKGYAKGRFYRPEGE